MAPVKNVAAVFCLMTTILSPPGFAKRSETLSESGDPARGKLFAVVRVEDNKLDCIRFTEAEHTPDNLEIPVCPTEGAISDEVDTAMALGLSGTAAKTAMASHITAGALGCVMGTSGALLGLSAEARWLDDLSLTGVMGGISLPGAMLAAAKVASGDPSGHLQAAAVGTYICGSGVGFLLLYMKYIY